jgi:gliding motility-associated-like protein
MTKLYKLVMGFGALMGILCSYQSKATHLMGADMTWKCLSGDTFEIVATVYRDCKGIELTNSPFSFYGECPGFETSQTLSGTMADGKDITPTCKKIKCTQCSQPCPENPYGFQQWTITAKVVFPKGCCKWKVSWTQNARNNAITTLDNPGGHSLYTEVEINTCIKNPCDNSPYFTIPPVAIFCLNECIVFNPGANDDDRDVNGQADSLAYSFGDPLDGENSKISYLSGYSNKEPLKYTGTDADATYNYPTCAGFHLDPQTGDIMFRATKEDITVMVVLVDEYRRDSLGNYKKIGTTRRDIEITIIDCGSNHAPVITGINGGTTNSIKICANTQTCFTIKSFDIDPGDTVSMTWNRQIPGASFTIKHDGKKWPTGVFCWRPTDKDVRSYPYQFIVSANDDHCLVPGRNSRAFNIYVVASPKANYFTTVQKCGSVYFQADPSAASKTSITDYLWTGEGAPGFAPLFIHNRKGTHQYERPGTYHYTLTITSPNGCTFSYFDSVKIAPYVEISLPKDSTVCQNAPPITIKAEHRLGNAPYTIYWNTGDKGDQITRKIFKDTVFVVYIKDGNGCTNYDSIRVKMQKLPKPDLGADQRGCQGHAISLRTRLAHVPYTSWTRINGKDTARNYLKGDTIPVIDSGMYIVAVRDSEGCPGYDTTNVRFNPPVKVIPMDTNVCQGDSVTLHAGISGPGSVYKWIDIVHQTVAGTAADLTIKKATNTTAGYHYLVKISQILHGVTCTDSGYINVKVHKIPKPLLTAPPAQCIDNPPLSLTIYADAAHRGGRWYYPPNPQAIVGEYLYPSIMGATDSIAGAGYIHYMYFDLFKCSSDDSVKIIIRKLPEVNAGPDAVVCKANGLYLLNNRPGITPSTGAIWYPAPGTPKNALVFSTFGDSVSFDPSKVSQDTAYAIVYSYSPGTGSTRCNNKDTVILHVKTNPEIVISKVDTLCADDEPVQLNATPSGGNWIFGDRTPASALAFDAPDQSFSFNPKIAGEGSHLLYYTAFADRQRKLCGTTDSLRIYVAPKPKNVDFHTEDFQREYCISHNPIKLIPTVPGGSFTGRGVYSIGNNAWFNPPLADSLDSNNNVITYTLLYNNGKCRTAVQHKIAIDSRPLVLIKSGNTLCEGSISYDITATIANADGEQWESDNGNTNFIKKSQTGNEMVMTFYPDKLQLQAGAFHIFLKGWNHGKCDTSRDTRQFLILPKPKIDFASERMDCEPFTVHFKSIEGMMSQGLIKSREWDFGDGSAHVQDRDPIHTYNVINGQNSQNFNVRLWVTSANGCTGDTLKKDWITVNASPVPLIFAKPRFTTIAMPEIQFSISDRSRNIDFSDPNTSFHWNFGDHNNKDKGGHSDLRDPVYTYSDTGKYTVVLRVNSRGCPGLDSEVNYIDIRPELIIFIPNVFKPDSLHGGQRDRNYFSAWENETFQPVVSDYSSFEMQIFNRWGELMYTTNNPEKGWNGKFKGENAMEGVYAYVIKATSYSGKPYTFTGTVTLLR